MTTTTPRSYRGLLCLLAVLGVAADQASKYGVLEWVRRTGQSQGPYESASGETILSFKRDIVPGGFELLAQFTDKAASTEPRPVDQLEIPKVNRGALFGFGGEHGHLANPIFAVVSIAAAAAIIYWGTRRSTAHDAWLCAALGLILAGTLGNLYDRIVFEGVRDFLHYFYLFEWPVFNVADCCLVCGAALLLMQAFLNRPAVPGTGAARSAAPSEMARAG